MGDLKIKKHFQFQKALDSILTFKKQLNVDIKKKSCNFIIPL
jgi:hypothetical protein